MVCCESADWYCDTADLQRKASKTNKNNMVIYILYFTDSYPSSNMYKDWKGDYC